MPVPNVRTPSLFYPLMEMRTGQKIKEPVFLFLLIEGRRSTSPKRPVEKGAFDHSRLLIHTKYGVNADRQ